MDAGHINALRANPFLTDATIMFIGEKNTGLESARMWDVVSDFPRTTALYQHRPPTTEKERMQPHVNPGIVTSKFAVGRKTRNGTLLTT